MRRCVKKTITSKGQQNVVRHIFGILLKFTRQTCMIWIREMTLWW